jgi:hypothetical protein
MGFWAAALDYCRNKKVFATSVQPRRLHQGKKNRRYTEAREMRSAGPLCTSLVPYLLSEPNCRIVSKISNLLLKVFHRPSIIRPNHVGTAMLQIAIIPVSHPESLIESPGSSAKFQKLCFPTDNLLFLSGLTIDKGILMFRFREFRPFKLTFQS